MNNNDDAISKMRPRNGGRVSELQWEIHNALRLQHPEWVEPNGDCPTCESYESRLAELLELSSTKELRQV